MLGLVFPALLCSYANGKLPSWLNSLPLEQQFVVRRHQRLFPVEKPLDVNWSLTGAPAEGTVVAQSFRVLTWGQWNWPLMVSTRERAYLELLDELPQHETFHMADVIMEGLTDVSPRRMQELLEDVKSVKVKRLFFLFADRHQHSWLKHIQRDKVDLGKGKRALVKGGKLNRTYQITVPEEFSGGKDHAAG